MPFVLRVTHEVPQVGGEKGWRRRESKLYLVCRSTRRLLFLFVAVLGFQDDTFRAEADGVCLNTCPHAVDEGGGGEQTSKLGEIQGEPETAHRATCLDC